jgi:hypothetical protein
MERNLVSKVQYNTFETGEFTERQDRSLTQTLQLIEAYPWDEQRARFAFSLTGPSITIESPDPASFLKLTPYYNDSYALFYLDPAHNLYLKKLSRPGEAAGDITAFFSKGQPGLESFLFSEHWYGGKESPFKDHFYRYTLRKAKAISDLLMTLVFITICTACAVSLSAGSQAFGIFPVLIVLYFFIALMLLMLARIINGILAAKGKELRLSKGMDSFYYGNIGQPREWNKNDIIAVSSFDAASTGRSMRSIGYARLDMRDGSALYLPEMLINIDLLFSKLPVFQRNNRIRLFSFIPLSALIPS